MNWVGGARSRIKLQNERRVQKDYFDRKRLVSKVKHARPPSPGGSKSKKYISQDLLFLQAVSNAHTTARQASAKVEAAPLHVQRVDLSGARRLDRFDRGLELPMSPIGEPSSLDLLDASTSGLSLYAEDQPKVSTQKIPHKTLLNSFGPGVKDREAQQQPIVSHSSGDSLSVLHMTEYAVPAQKKQQPQQFKQQHYQVPQKVPATRCDASVDSWQSTCGAAGFGVKRISKTVTAKRRREASFDRETPFNFETQAVKKPHLQKLPPKSKDSLLAFHNEERETRSRHTKVHTATKPVHGYEIMLGLEPVESMTAGIPLKASTEPAVSDSAKEFPFPWTNVTTTSRSSSTSSLLDEDPLSHMKKPHCLPPQANHAKTSQPSHQSTSTLFDESIIGPLSKQEMKKQFQCSPKTNHAETSFPPQSASTLFDESIFGALSKLEQLDLPLQEERAETNPPAPQSVSTVFDESIFGPLLRKESNTADHTSVHNMDTKLQSRKASAKLQSTFEQMMLSFEEGSSCNEAPNVELKVEDTSARHMEWRNFISGRDVSGEVQLGTADLLDSRPRVNTSSDDSHEATLTNKADDRSQKQLCQRTNGEDKRSLPGCLRVGQKNISVLEGLLCLDEEITSSLESEVLASQDITLSPGELSTEDPIQRVPDIDAQSSEESLSSDSCLEIREDLSKAETKECQDREIIHESPVDSSDKNDDCNNGGMVGFCCVDKMHCSAQTEPVPIKVYRKVCCECDIWTGETVQQCRCCKQAKQVDVSTSTVSPTFISHETQTVAEFIREEAGLSVSSKTNKTTPHVLTLEGVAISNCVQMDSIGVQYDNTDYLKDQNTQTDLENVQVDANECIISESLCGKLDSITADATTQMTDHCATVKDLEAQIKHLKEKLGLAESTVIWQSVMMKLYQM